MKKTKRGFCFLMAGIMVLGMMAGCGCGKSVDPETSNTQTNTQTEDEKWQEQYELGLKCLKEQQYEEAVIAFTAAIDIRPNSTDSYVSRGNAYYEWGYSLLEDSERQTVTLTDIPMKITDEAAEKYVQASNDYEESRKQNSTSSVADRKVIADTVLSDYYADRGDEEKSNEYQEKVQQLIDEQEVSDEIIEKLEQHEQADNSDETEKYLLVESLWQPFQWGNSEKEVYTYDADGRLTQKDSYRVYDLDSNEEMLLSTTTYSYDEQGHLLNELYETISDGYMLETEYRYDDTWKLVKKVTYDNFEGNYEWTDYEYNENGELNITRNWFGQTGAYSFDVDNSSGGELLSWRRYAYNEEGILLNIFCYDGSGEEILTFEEAYDSYGNLTSQTSYSTYDQSSPEVVTFENTYDEFGNLLKQEELENGEIMIGTRTNTWQLYSQQQ
ncbi:MAG: hypothetical protein ACI4TF_13745 [Oliverpabstia sp.]